VFRYFLSWRYLHSRRTNLIAIVGLCLAVGAMIMILSIMTGFLEEARRVARGSLSDVVVAPNFGERADGSVVRSDRRALLEAVRADPRVRGATARLTYYGILQRPGYARSGARSEDSDGGILVRTASATLAGVQLVGVDVLSDTRIALAGVGHWLALHGLRLDATLEDEFDTTEFLQALRREPLQGRRVDRPLFPFRPVSPDAPDAPPSAVVGEQLFGALDLERGDVIDVLTAHPDPRTGAVEQRTQRFTVAGSFRSGANDADLSRIYVDRRALARFVGGDRDFSEVYVNLVNYRRDRDAVCASLTEELRERDLINGTWGQEVRPWEHFGSRILASIENQRTIMTVLLSLVLLVAAFTIFAIQSMMVSEKRRDVGILAALGATPAGQLALFVMIAVWDVVLGASVGAGLGTWAALEIDGIEQWLSGVLGVQIINRDLYMFDTIPSQVKPLAVAAVLASTLVASVLFAAVPAFRAARLDPLQAVRQD
jgi:lipoprotein-releasing system permease protein